MWYWYLSLCAGLAPCCPAAYVSGHRGGFLDRAGLVVLKPRAVSVGQNRCRLLSDIFPQLQTMRKAQVFRYQVEKATTMRSLEDSLKRRQHRR